MDFSLETFHHRNRSKIIQEWVKRLHSEVGDQYASRPVTELMDTVSEAFEADYHVLVQGDYKYINKFIDKITEMRLKSGFLLSDVQKAFELYRSIALPLLAEETSIPEFFESVDKINRCLAYTIHRFSDHFQNMHEKQIVEHNRRLEEEVRAQTAQLMESELKYKTLVEEINDGYFVVQNEHIVFANQAFCQMHEYALEEILGRKFHDFVAPESREKVRAIYKRSYQKKDVPRSFEYRRLLKSGKCFLTEILAKNTRYDNRPSSIGICRDITERVKMEQRVREAERMAYIGQITTSLSHEIRNPLSAVKMNLQILKKNPQLLGNDQRRIDISVKEVIRLERILKEILDFAKPLQVKFGPANVNEILISCIELLDMKFKEKNLSIKKVLEPLVPKIFADSEKLGQAFINLILNAIESSDDTGRICIKTLYQPDGGSPHVDVLIQDEGNGVPDEILGEIFKPFFTTKSKGTGLGLSNVKRIIEAHGGWVEPEQGHARGASFRVTIPINKKDYGQDSHSR
jgi:PAS domain S-box-containing protein